MDSGVSSGFISQNQKLLDAQLPEDNHRQQQVLWNVMTSEDLDNHSKSYMEKRESPNAAQSGILYHIFACYNIYILTLIYKYNESYIITLPCQT